MHALSLNSKFLIERTIFPTFLATQIDKSSPAAFVLHRSLQAPEKGLKTSLILLSSVTGVGVTFLPWKEKDRALYDEKLLVLFFPQISMYMLNEKVFVIDISASQKKNYL